MRGRNGASAPFVVLNCAALHPDRLEEELFGVESDDGDGPRKIGTLEQADGGTLLLDEVADMPLATQGKIVRVLQEQILHPSRRRNTRVEVDVRVIASSNRDLPSEIEEGRFREDLLLPAERGADRASPSLSERTRGHPGPVRRISWSGRPNCRVCRPRTIGADAMVGAAGLWLAGQCAPAAQRGRLAADHGDRRQESAPIHTDMLPPEIGAITPAVDALGQGGESWGLPCATPANCSSASI